MTDSAPDLSTARWVKSSLSADAGNCVEVAFVNEVVAMRDSKDPAGSVLAFSREEWAAFVGGVRRNEFDL